MRRRGIGVAGWLLVAGAAVPAAAQVKNDPPVETQPALIGDWRFDAARSDDLDEKLKGARGGGMPRGMGPGSGGRGRGGGGGERGSGGLPGFGGGGGSLLVAPQQLSFEAGDDGLRVRTDLGIPRPLPTDGREVVDTLSDMSVRTSKARWNKAKLEVERRAGDFGRIRETYWVEPNTDLLVVEVRIEGPRKVEFRRVYVRAGN
ncbi:MAG: hypothetical protein AB7L66_14610 [Gemmatimonadales bacterium]